MRAPLVVFTALTALGLAVFSSPNSSAQPTLPWLDRPPGPGATPVCPAAGQWILGYWSNTQTLAESTLFSCPNVDRLWTLVDGRWLGWGRDLSAVNDVFLVPMGQAAFLHGSIPSVVATITPTAAVAPVRIDLIAVTSPVSRGGQASASFATEPGILCTAEFVSISLQPERLPDLPPKMTDTLGNVRWDWMIPASTARGSASLVIRCGNGVRAAQFEIE